MLPSPQPDVADVAEVEPERERSGPHVVHVAANTIVVDARVLKTAFTTAGLGLRTTCVGIGGRPRDTRLTLGPVEVVQVGVPARATVSGPVSRWRRFWGGLGQSAGALAPWYGSTAEYRAALGRWEFGTRELRADRGRDLVRGDRDQPRGQADRVRRALVWRGLRVRKVVLAVRARPGLWTERLRGRRPSAGWTGPAARDVRLQAFRNVPQAARWRHALPELLDQDLAVGGVLDRLEPDVVHVHDVFMLGTAVRSAHRAALDGRTVKVVYDAHEYVRGLAVLPARRVAAFSQLEDEYIGDADRVVTVSEMLADWLVRDHDLARRPAVVANAPVADDGTRAVRPVRELCDLDASVPLLVYGGGVNAARGVRTAVDALALLPEVHLAVVMRKENTVTAALRRRADEIGVGDRVHYVGFADPEVVPRYLSSADIGLSPLLRAPNHDVALTNKFCEYLSAGIPIVTSDTPVQARLVEELDLGAVHAADDPADLARAVREVLGRLPELKERIRSDEELRRRFSWEASAETLREVYDELLGELPPQAWSDGATTVDTLWSKL